MLAIPISPLARPLPSTTATMTDGACADTAEDGAGDRVQRRTRMNANGCA